MDKDSSDIRTLPLIDATASSQPCEAPTNVSVASYISLYAGTRGYVSPYPLGEGPAPSDPSPLDLEMALNRALSEALSGFSPEQLDMEIQTQGAGTASVQRNSALKREASTTVAPESSKRSKNSTNAKFLPARVFRGRNSPLATSPLKSVFSNPEAFESLSQMQKESLISMMPNNDNISREENDIPRIKPGFLMYDQDWQHGIRGFQEDVQEGRYDPVWLSKAIEASKVREEGGFDNFKESQYEEYWGQKQLVPLAVVAGLNSSMKIENLMQANVLRVGDIFVIRSKHRRSDKVWEKEATIVGANEKKQPNVKISRERSNASDPQSEDIVLIGVTGPGTIVRAVEGEIGEAIRDKRKSEGCSWRLVRVRRGDEDLGSLWDIRQAYHFAQREGDYKAFLEGTPTSHRRRMLKFHKRMGFIWIDEIPVLLKKVALSDVSLQPPQTVMPMSPEFRRALGDVLEQGYCILKIDSRVLNEDGIPLPEGVHIQEMMDTGPTCFNTEFTRKLAMQHGPGWSGGRAHLGSLALGYPVMSQSPKTMYLHGCLQSPGDGQKLHKKVYNDLQDDGMVSHTEENTIKTLVRAAFALRANHINFRQPPTPPYPGITCSRLFFEASATLVRDLVHRAIDRSNGVLLPDLGASAPEIYADFGAGFTPSFGVASSTINCSPGVTSATINSSPDAAGSTINSSLDVASSTANSDVTDPNPSQNLSMIDPVLISVDRVNGITEPDLRMNTHDGALGCEEVLETNVQHGFSDRTSVANDEIDTYRDCGYEGCSDTCSQSLRDVNLHPADEAVHSSGTSRQASFANKLPNIYHQVELDVSLCEPHAPGLERQLPSTARNFFLDVTECAPRSPSGPYQRSMDGNETITGQNSIPAPRKGPDFAAGPDRTSYTKASPSTTLALEPRSAPPCRSESPTRPDTARFSPTFGAYEYPDPEKCALKHSSSNGLDLDLDSNGDS